MSLKEAVLAIADGIEEDAGAVLPNGEPALSPVVEATLRGYAKQLRIAVKASGDGPAPGAFMMQPDMSSMMQPDMSSAMFSHRAMIEKAKSEFAGKIKPIEGAGDVGHDQGGQQFHDNMDRMFPVVGGPVGGNDTVEAMAPLPSNAPVGCHTVLAGAVYTLQEDNRLHYDEDQTRRYVLNRTRPEGTITVEKKSLVLTTEMDGVSVVEND